jgi:lysophospholipase L1-like esterase
MAQSRPLWPRFTVPGMYQCSRRLQGERAMRVRRFAVRASALVACIVLTGSGLHGGTLGAGAAPAQANSQTVQVEYKGSQTATTITPISNDGTTRTDVSTITWDLVWSGTLDELLHGNSLPPFVPRTLTGTTKTTYSRPLFPTHPCTASLSWNPVTVIPMGATLGNGGSDASTMVISAWLPDNKLRSSGTGDCSTAGSYGAPVLDPKHLKDPTALFSMTNLGKKQSQNFSGTEKTKWPHSYDATMVINSTITFAGASCTGSDGSSGQDLLFGCYVALGDSYSAGQMPPFVPGGEACLRSTRAYAYLYDKHVAFAACSGAQIANVLSEQISFVQKTTKLVTITIGGNDTSIFDTLRLCLTKSFSLFRCENAYPPPNFTGLYARLVSLYKAIHDRAPTARLFIFGYPNVLPSTAPIGCTALYLPNSRVGVYPSDVPYFYKLVTKLNDTVHRAAQDSGVATFISPDLGFTGHDVCSNSSYFFPLTALDPRTLHPNAEGHAQLASLLRRAAGPPPD